jgi:hypothetical protein
MDPELVLGLAIVGEEVKSIGELSIGELGSCSGFGEVGRKKGITQL